MPPPPPALPLQAVGGSEEEALAWLERQMAPAELAAERQAFERMAQQLAAQTLGARDARGSGGGKGGKRR